MGQASRAPNLKDATNIEFSTHALERIRERLPPGSHYQSMPDPDIRRRVEEAWQNAQRADAVEEWWQLNDNQLPEMIFIIDLKDSLDSDIVGLFRENDRRAGVPVLITVLTHDMAAKKKTSNKWAKSSDKIGRRELLQTPLKDGLSGVSALPKPAPVARAQEKTAEEQGDIILVTWWSADTAHHSKRVDKEDVSGFVTSLLDKGIPMEEISFWTKVVPKVRKVVTIDF